MSGYPEHGSQEFDQKWPSHLLTSAAGAASARVYFWLWAEVLKQSSFKKNTRGTVPKLWRSKHHVRGTGCASKGVQVTIWKVSCLRSTTSRRSHNERQHRLATPSVLALPGLRLRPEWLVSPGPHLLEENVTGRAARHTSARNVWAASAALRKKNISPNWALAKVTRYFRKWATSSWEVWGGTEIFL